MLENKMKDSLLYLLCGPVAEEHNRFSMETAITSNMDSVSLKSERIVLKQQGKQSPW